MNLKAREKKVVVLASGGMDSSTLMLKLANDGFKVFPFMVIHNGKLASMEIKSARSVISWLNNNGHRIEELKTIDMESMKKLREEGIEGAKSSFFPFRNLIFASIGALYGYTNNINNIAMGLCKSIFPDCTPTFQNKLKAVLTESVSEEFDVIAPFITQNKSEIVKYGNTYGFPYEKTYSCYKGGKNHCGICDGCQGRKISFQELGTKDPTPNYER